MKCDGGARAVDVIYAEDEEACSDFLINGKFSVDTVKVKMKIKIA